MGTEQKVKPTIHNAADFSVLYRRAEQLALDAKPIWGSMNVAQMLAHANRSIEVGLGTFTPPSEANWFGRTIIKRVVLNRDLWHNSPTAKAFKVTDTHEFEKEKAGLFANLKAAQAKGLNGSWAPHVSFGVLTPEEWGVLIYKHINHHLSQFGV
jgi:hypothetical protein